MGHLVTVDCRGMQCPAPILRVAKTARDAKGQPLLMEVFADDSDFPNDLEAWCRTSRATLHEMVAEDSGLHRAVIGLNGASRSAVLEEVAANSQSGLTVAPTPAPVAPPAAPLVAAVPTPSAPESRGTPEPVSHQIIDLRGLRAPEPILRLSTHLGQLPGQTASVASDDGQFVTDLVAWAAATRTTIEEIRSEGGTTNVRLRFPGTAATTVARGPASPPPLPNTALVPVNSTTALATTSPDAVPRNNQATLLVLRNDFESLMAALLVATTSAAQGMDVVIFFSFWGVNVLRADKLRETNEGPVSIMQRMMKWMMPKGPSRQKLSKMNMGGMGKGMMEMLMRRNHVMSIPELMDTAVEQQVKFVVCTMSMGIMGIQKRDLVDLPNMDYAGVTLFVEQSRQSAMSMVF